MGGRLRRASGLQQGVIVLDRGIDLRGDAAGDLHRHVHFGPEPRVEAGSRKACAPPPAASAAPSAPGLPGTSAPAPASGGARSPLGRGLIQIDKRHPDLKGQSARDLRLRAECSVRTASPMRQRCAFWYSSALCSCSSVRRRSRRSRAPSRSCLATLELLWTGVVCAGFLPSRAAHRRRPDRTEGSTSGLRGLHTSPRVLLLLT